MAQKAKIVLLTMLSVITMITVESGLLVLVFHTVGIDKQLTAMVLVLNTALMLSIVLVHAMVGR